MSCDLTDAELHELAAWYETGHDLRVKSALLELIRRRAAAVEDDVTIRRLMDHNNALLLRQTAHRLTPDLAQKLNESAEQLRELADKITR